MNEAIDEAGQPSLTGLMARLTRVDPSWAVWKSAERAVSGVGDVDSVASRSAWPALTDEVAAWARTQGLGPTIACRHLPRALLIVVCAGRSLVQIDVHERAAGVIAARRLTPLTAIDERGFRVVRPGAQALLILVSRARRGRAPLLEDATRREVESLLAADPQGAADLAAAFGPPGRLLLGALHTQVSRRRQQGGTIALELFLAWRALCDPRARLAWLAFRARRRRCAVVAALANGRRMPSEQASWLRSVERTHLLVGR